MNSSAWLLVGLATVLLVAVAAAKVIEARRHYRQLLDDRRRDLRPEQETPSHDDHP